MLEELKEKVFKANLDLVKHGLVLFTWGNASGIDREKELVVIKPSGVSYDKMKPKDMVVLNLYGQVIEGELKQKIFSMETDPVAIFHVVRLVEIISSVADHAENAGDMMRAMISRKKGTFFGEKL